MPRFSRLMLIAAGLLAVLWVVLTNPALDAQPRTSTNWADRQVRWTMQVLLLIPAAGTLIWAARTRGRLRDDVRYVLRHRRPLAALMAAVSAVVLAIFIVELLFGLLLAFSPQTNVEWKGSITERFYTSDPLLGYKPEPGITATASKIVNGQAVYDVRYSIDDAGRRLTPASAADAAGPIVLFFGDSNMFGEGVEDDQTTPNQFALLAPQPVTVLNYGFSGYGPNQMLAMLEAGRLDPVVRDKDVIAIYGYIDGHIHRVIGGMNVVTWWAIDTPRYVRDDSGRPVYADSFARSRPVVNWFYAVFSRSRTVRYFGIDLPLRRKEHLLLTADVIRRSAEELKSRARSSRFYVLVWPTTSTSGLLREAFVGAPVEVLDYSTQWQQHDLRYEYPHDRHPTPAGHRLAAGLLSDDITVRPADDK